MGRALVCRSCSGTLLAAPGASHGSCVFCEAGVLREVERVAGALGNIGPISKIAGKVVGQLQGFTAAVQAYRGKVGLLFACLFAKFVTHFTTAAVYFFTALAIGVTTAQFWPITFGSTIQILATVLSPTIAGEGAREAFQALLLSNQLLSL